MLYSAFILGLLGSWHCIGMCGPIGMVIPVPREKRFLGFLLYHAGRVMMYAAFGILLGMVSYSVMLFEFQRSATLIAGFTVIAVSLAPYLTRSLKSAYFGSRLMTWVKQHSVKQFKQKTFASTFAAGILNGFLPCGLIYLAAAAAMTADSVQQGATIMALFGLGTLPGLFAVWMLPNLHFKKVGSSLVKFAPAFSLIMGLLLVYRGISVEMPVLDSYLGAIGFGNITMCR